MRRSHRGLRFRVLKKAGALFVYVRPNAHNRCSDYNKLLELHPEGSAQARDVERALRSLAPRVEVAQKQEVDEMLGKLKGIGNTVLGQSLPWTTKAFSDCIIREVWPVDR